MVIIISCGFQVIDPTVAWIVLSRVAVGATSFRGHSFLLVSYSTTVVVMCIPRQLAVVVSLKKYAALLCCTCVIRKSLLLHWYMISRNELYVHN